MQPFSTIEIIFRGKYKRKSDKLTLSAVSQGPFKFSFLLTKSAMPLIKTTKAKYSVNCNKRAEQRERHSVVD